MKLGDIPLSRKTSILKCFMERLLDQIRKTQFQNNEGHTINNVSMIEMIS